MVQNALESLKQSNSDNWQLAFLDDSSDHPGSCVGEKIFGDTWKCMKCYNTLMTTATKTASGGMMGKLMNRAIQESSAELAIMLCDDDAIAPDYFSNLDKWFTNHPDEMACYSHVHEFNPIFENFRNVNNLVSPLNHSERLLPWAKVDASQVAWRTHLNKEKNVWFQEGITKFLDAHFYERLGQAIGAIPFSGFVGQYKACHSTQLSNHKLEDLWGVSTVDVPTGEKITPVEFVYPIINRYIEQNNKEEARRICEKAINLHPADTNLYLLLREAS